MQAEIEEPILRQPCKKEPLDIPPKKAKFIDEKYLLDYQYQAMLLAQYQQQQHQFHNFRPWAHLVVPPPSQTSSATSGSIKHLPHLPYAAAVAAAAAAASYLSQEPPVLQNPERVVRLSECERFEQSYQPNVALVPRGNSKTSTSSNVNIKNRDVEREHEFKCGDRDQEQHGLPMNIKIKQERPQTPPEESLSPESRMESPPAASITNPAPISPEGQSGSSNEITSSTSPVPATTTSHQPIESTIHSPKTPPPPTDNHHIHHLMLRSHHHQLKTSDGQLHESHQSDSSNNHHSHLSLSNGIFHHKLNGGTGSHTGNSEFELSTDTDDDSLAGEADSSATIAPLDIAIEALKDSRPQDRDKVLNIIKMLLNENLQIGIKNAKLKQELRRKDDEIADLLQLNRRAHNGSTNSSNCSSNTSSTIRPVESTSIINKSEQKPMVNDTNRNKSLSVESLTNAGITTGTTIIEVGTGTVAPTTTLVELPRKKCETEVIRMPLKKSVRRSPEETPVIMQPHKLRDEARDKARDKLDKITRYFERSTKSPSPSSISQNNLVATKANEAA